MKIYRQEEWVKAYEEEHEGRLVINGANIDRSGIIKSLRTTTLLTATLSAFGEIDISFVKVDGKNKQFAMRDGEILVIADSEETYRFEPMAPCELENPHVIPMRTWLKDFIECENRRARSDEDRIAKVSFEGCELDGKMRIRWLNARVTWDHCYGPFGPLTTDMHIEVGRDIMNGTYGMHRHESIRDDWEPNCCGDHGHRAFFTKDFDVLWSDDGRYDEPRTPYYSRIERIKWRASA